MDNHMPSKKEDPDPIILRFRTFFMMKLVFVFLSAFIAIGSGLSLGVNLGGSQDKCCPCDDDGPTGDIIEYVITIDRQPDDPSPLINFLIKILVDSKILKPSTAANILFTFQFQLPSFLPETGVVKVTPDTPFSDIGGRPDARDRFIVALRILLKRPSVPGFIKALIEFILNNRLSSVPQIFNIFIKFCGFVPTINVNIPAEKVPTTTTTTTTTTRATTTTTTKKPVTYPSVPLEPGKPCESLVSLTSVPEEPDVIVTYLLKLLAPKILDVVTASRIIVTFFPSMRPHFDVKPFGPSDTIVCKGEQKAKDKFIKILVQLFKDPDNPETPTHLIKVLLELILDNGLISPDTVTKIVLKFGFGIKLQVIEIPKVEEPALKPAKLPGANLQIVSTVEITEIVQDLKPLIKRLIQLIINAKLFPKTLGDNILLTFEIETEGLNIDGKASIGGNPKAGEKFGKALEILITRKPLKNLGPLVKILVEFLIDNVVYDHESLLELVGAYGCGGSVSIEYIEIRSDNGGTGFEFKPGQKPAGHVIIDSTITITEVKGDLKPCIKNLVELSIKAGLVPQNIGAGLLASFKITSGSALLPSLLANAQIGGSKTSSKKFVTVLTQLLANPAGKEHLLVKILAELLVDNFVVDSESILNFIVSFGCHVGIRVRQMDDPDRVEEPELQAGEKPERGQVIDSTITITGTNRDIKPLIARLGQLLVKAGLCSSANVQSILATFTDASGSKLSASAVAALKIGGDAAAGKKFSAGLSKCVGNPSNLNAVVKVLGEILIDNAVYNYESMMHFISAYGVSLEVGVRITTAAKLLGGLGLDLDLGVNLG